MNEQPTLAVVTNDRIRVRSTYEQRDLCKSLPGYRWDPAAKVWHYPATPEVARAVRETFGDSLRVDPAFNKLLEQAHTAVAARSMRDRDDLDDIPGTVPAWLHQRQAYHFSHGQNASMLAVGMGGGKTKVAIALMEGWAASRVLVICPPSVVNVWPKEFSGDPDTGKPGHAVRTWTVIADRKGSVAKRTAAAQDAFAAATSEHPVCIVINYEAAYREPFGDWALSVEWDVVILDESHRIKAPGGVQSKWCGRLLKAGKRRLALTGTPMPHSPLDVYAQFRFLDPGVYGTSYSRFRQRYALMGGWQGKEVLGIDPDHSDELTNKFRSLAYVITKADLDKALDLPAALDLPWQRIKLEPKARRAYDQLDKDFVADVNNGTVVVNNALTRLLRLQQVTSGHLPVDRPCPACDGLGCPTCKGAGVIQTTEIVGDEKRKLLADRLVDVPLREPVVIFARFLHDLDSVRAVCADQGRVYGELSGRSKAGLTDRATMSPDVDIVGVQMQSGGVGIDLSRARYAIYYSLGFSLGEYEQSRARVHRPGQTRTTYYDHLIAADTVDEIVMRALAARKNVVEAVLDAARKGEL